MSTLLQVIIKWQPILVAYLHGAIEFGIQHALSLLTPSWMDKHLTRCQIPVCHVVCGKHVIRACALLLQHTRETLHASVTTQSRRDLTMYERRLHFCVKFLPACVQLWFMSKCLRRLERCRSQSSSHLLCLPLRKSRLIDAILCQNTAINQRVGKTKAVCFIHLYQLSLMVGRMFLAFDHLVVSLAANRGSHR